MSRKDSLLAKANATLLDPFLSSGGARTRLESWLELGVLRAWACTGLLANLETEDYPSLAITGVVGYPTGGSTLSTKRMELLECARLGARAAAVVLTPSLVASGEAAGLDREMGSLLATARDFPLYFLIEAGGLDERAVTVLSRLLRDRRPAGLVTGSGLLGPPPPGPQALGPLRSRIPRKVTLIAGGDVRDPDEARALLKGGAEAFLTSEPQRFAGLGP
jgi:deoxyribose-phosphate aldolase